VYDVKPPHRAEGYQRRVSGRNSDVRRRRRVRCCELNSTEETKGLLCMITSCVDVSTNTFMPSTTQEGLVSAEGTTENCSGPTSMIGNRLGHVCRGPNLDDLDYCEGGNQGKCICALPSRAGRRAPLTPPINVLTRKTNRGPTTSLASFSRFVIWTSSFCIHDTKTTSGILSFACISAGEQALPALDTETHLCIYLLLDT